jgi:hypothetical protein
MNHPSRPRRGELLTIALFAIALRLIIFVAEISGGHISLTTYTNKGDTASYIANAQVMTGERSMASLNNYETRVFPGYPAMIAVVHRLGIPLRMSALLVTWICAGIAAAVAGKVFNDARIGWAMTCLIPHYLINSSLGMSEAPMLAIVCLALLASQKDQLVLAGVLFGFAGMIRPMACFALAGLLFALLREGKWKPAVAVLGTAVGMFCFEIAMVQLWTGDAMRGVHVYAQHPDAYAGHMFAWPFQSLLTTPGHDGASVGRIIYIWIHVIITLLACGMSADRALRAGRSRPRDAVSFVWLVGNTAFILCIGGVWGFRHFHRFTIPAAPAMFWTLRNLLPRSQRWWLIIGLISMLLAMGGVFDSP